MSKIKNYKKKIAILIFILVIVMIALIILLKVFEANDDLAISKEKLAYINSEEWNDELFPKGMPAFLRSYSGEQTSYNIGKNIYYVADELIPKYNKNLKDLSEQELKEYFEENRELIEINFGVRTERDFMTLMKKILKINSTSFQLQNFYIDESSVMKSDSNTKATLYIKYDGADEIKIDIKVYNQLQETVSSIMYY